jgi:hypothetical protein
VHFLIETLQKLYQITIDWTGSKYLKMTIDHNIKEQTITLSMPGYISKALTRFGIADSEKRVNTPGPHIKPQYGNHTQESYIDESPKLSTEHQKFIQQVVGVMLYYARAIDCTMLCAVNRIASRQATPTQDLLRDTYHLLYYAQTWPNATITFRPSNMKLRINSDASYNSETKARSRAAAYFDLTSNNADNVNEPVNGNLLVTSKLIDCVVASAAEAEYAACFMAGQEAMRIKLTLEDMGYIQDQIPIYTDNQCAAGIANMTVYLKKAKTMDMRFHWIRDKVRTKIFSVTWHPGKDNRADYFTKMHPTSHHLEMRRLYVGNNKSLPGQSSRGVLDQAAHSSYDIGQVKAVFTKAKDLKDHSQ